METPLKKLRVRRGFTQKQVEQGTGIDQGTLSRIENGARTTPENAAAIVKFFGEAMINELQILYPERYVQDDRLRSQEAAA